MLATGRLPITVIGGVFCPLCQQKTSHGIFNMEGKIKGNDSVVCETEPLLNRAPRLSGRERAASRWVTVEPLLLLAACSYMLTAVLRIQYVLVRVQESYNYTVHTDSPCPVRNQTGNMSYISDADTQARIQADSARWMLLFSLAGALPGFVSAILMGALSDRFGRKIFLNLSTIGSASFAGVCTAVMAFNLRLEVFLAADLAIGLTGGQMTIVSLCYSYIADVTTKKQRTFRIVVIETVYVLVGLTQIGAEYCYEALGFAATAGIATGLGVLAFIYSVIPHILIETIERKGQQPLGQTLRQTVRGVGRLFYSEGGTVRTWCLLLIFATLFMLTPMESSLQVKTLYVQAEPFCWSPVTIGYNAALFSTVLLVGNIGGFKLLSKCFSSQWIFHISCFSTVGVNVVFGLVRTNELLFWATLLLVLSGLCFPVLRGSLSKLVGADEQGVALSFLGCVENFGMYVSPIAVNAVYMATVASYAPLVFFVIAGITCVPPVLFGIMHVVIKRSIDPQILASHTVTD
ncbi:solute carrier family 46 member 3-like [Patiria miniata]|uniref:Proton-coupled folate transporter n=1 Tax=Patiria miniata TaxID=46514 RepID=A0A914BT78_PATMI|nr:solute carrier family 46 member 3-like [Patiria miniata]